MTKPQKILWHTCKVITILLCAVTLAYPQEEQAVAAYNRGQAAFQSKDYNRARSEFTQSYSLQPDRLTAYLLCYAYLELTDFSNAYRWANIALTPLPPYVLDK